MPLELSMVISHFLYMPPFVLSLSCSNSPQKWSTSCVYACWKAWAQWQRFVAIKTTTIQVKQFSNLSKVITPTVNWVQNVIGKLWVRVYKLISCQKPIKSSLICLLSVRAESFYVLSWSNHILVRPNGFSVF